MPVEDSEAACFVLLLDFSINQDELRPRTKRPNRDNIFHFLDEFVHLLWRKRVDRLRDELRRVSWITGRSVERFNGWSNWAADPDSS